MHLDTESGDRTGPAGEKLRQSVKAGRSFPDSGAELARRHGQVSGDDGETLG